MSRHQPVGGRVQPVNTLSSLAFVLVGIAIAISTRRRPGAARPTALAICLIATGVGSVAYHGPQPAGAELMHDLPIVFMLALISLHNLSLLVPRFDSVMTLFAAFAVALTGLSMLVPAAAPLAGAR